MRARLITMTVILILASSDLMAQNSWRMEGINPSRTNTSLSSGPTGLPVFRVIASNVVGGVKRIADDGSLILTDASTISSYTSRGVLQWSASPLQTLGGQVVDVAVSSSGTVYASSANAVVALDAHTGQAIWPAAFVANSGDESATLVIAHDGTIYFHTGSAQQPFQERLTAINPDGSLKWNFAGNTGRGNVRPVVSPEGSTIYLNQRSAGGAGTIVGLSATSGEVVSSTQCGIENTVYSYSSKSLYAGAQSNLLKFLSRKQPCVVSASGTAVSDTAAALNSGLIVVKVPLPGKAASYALIDSNDHLVWSQIEPLSDGFADTPPGEGSGTFFAVAPETNEVVAIRTATGTELWRQRFPSPISGLMLGEDGSLYLVSGNAIFRGDSPVSPTRTSSTLSSLKGTDAFVAALSATGIRAAYGFDEGSGTTTADSSGNSYTGTLVNGVSWTAAGKNGNGLSFDGLDDKVTLPNTVDVSALPFTLESWIRPVNFNVWDAIFSKRDGYAANQMRFDIGLRVSDGRVYITTYTSMPIFDYSPPLNTWTHLAIAAASTGTSLYINGVLQQTLPAVILGTGANAKVAIGASADNEDHFAGLIDDVRLYGRLLSVSEIQTDMATPAGNSGPVFTITQPSPGASVTSTTVNITYTTTGDTSQVNHVQFTLDSNPEVTDSTVDGVFQITNVPSGNHTLSGYLARADNTKIAGTDASVTFSTTTPGDTTPPTVSIIGPTNGSTVSGTISITATASDNVGIAGVQFLLDGQAFGSEVTAAPYTLPWDTTTATGGAHTLAARARDLSGNLTTSASVSVTVSNSGNNPALVGQWSAPFSWPLVAVHLNLLPTGKVLAWDDAVDHANHTAVAEIWDPVANAFTDVTNSTGNLFCAGQTQLPDGRIAVVGGHIDNDIGIKEMNLFDPFTQTWSAKAPMSYARWYPTATTLSDGRVLALVGTQNGKDSIASVPEIYDPVADSWQKLTGATSAFARYFPHTFVLPDGKLLVTGTSQVANATQFAIPTRTLDINTQTWAVVDPNTNAEGLSAMYTPGKVVRIGGTWDDGSGFPVNTTSILDMTVSNPAWRTTTPMHFSRILHNLTILADGSVLTTGGATDAALNPPASSILYAAEIWSPAAETWTTMASMQTQRLYHSTAILLADGRVLVAGGGRAFTTDEFNGEIFSPPYLFKGARPTITSAPSAAVYGATIFVATPNAAQIAKVSLVRLSSVTHTTNFNQRYAQLAFTPGTGGLNVTIPANANLAPPGYYMIFILDGNGVPSVATFIQLIPADSTSPTAPGNLTAAASSSTQVNLTWTASTDNVGVAEYRVERCTGSGCSSFGQIGTTTTTSYADAGLTTGTIYRYRVRAADASGNLSPYSNTATATTVNPDTTPPTNPSNLAASAASTSQINLTWTASTDNVGVAQYWIERCAGSGCNNFAQVGTSTTATYADAGLTAGTSYSYRVRAADAAGNLSGYSNLATATTPNPPPQTGLVAAYSFDEGSGTTVTDASNNANTGTIAAATWTTSGKYGKALSFNGSTARVTINDAASLHLTNGMTLEAWVNPTATPTGWRDLIYKQNDVYYLEASSTIASAPTAGGTFGNGSQNITGVSVLPVNTWTHLAVTFDGAKLTLWINGISIATQLQTSPLTTSTLPLQIGGDSLYGQGFAGLIDEVRVYNRALSQSELEVDMNTPVGTIVDTTPPTAPGNARAFAGGAPATIIARQGYINSSNQSSHTTAAFDSTGSDLIVVFASSHENVATLTLTDNKANTWTTIAGPTNHPSTSIDLRSQLWYSKPTVTGTGHTVTFSLSTANAAVISVFVIKGSRTSAPIDATTAITNDSGVSTALTSAAISTTQPADLLIDFAKSSIGTTWTADPAYAFESVASSNYLAAEQTFAGIPGSYTAGWSMNPGVNWQNVLTSVVSANASTSNSQITMIWTPSSDTVGVTGYKIERCPGSGCSNFALIGSTTGFSTTTYTDTALSAGTTYTYRIRATDSSGNLGSYSSVVSATTTGAVDTTPPGAPTNLAAAAVGTDQINLTWTASTDNVGVTGYVIERCQGSGCSSFAQIATSTATSYSDTGLPASTNFSYRVLATDAAGNRSGYSNTASATTGTAPPTAPSNLTATAASATQINLSWTASTSSVGILNYVIERCQGGGCSGFASIATVTTTAYSDLTVASGLTYLYRVRATDTNNTPSGYSNTATATTPDTIPPTAPSNLTAAAVGNQINLAWTAATDNVGVTGYVIERCQGTGCSSFAEIATRTTTSYSDTGLPASTSFSYRVLAIDAAGNRSTYSSSASATTGAAPPTAPSNLTAAASSGTQIDLSWTASTSTIGILNYVVERCQGSGCSSFASIATPTTTTYSDLTVASGLTYSYRVRATDTNNVSSGYSNVATATTPDTIAPTAPSNLTATPISNSQINLAWTASTDNVGVTGYRIERCTLAGCSNFAQIATGSGTTYSDQALTASTSYSYRVRATDAAGNLSTYSNVATATTLNSPPPGAPAVAFSFNEGTGTSAADASGNGLNGTLVNGTAWITGKNGNAVSFDGLDDKVSISSTLDISALPFTVEAWVRPANRSSWHVIFSKRATYSASGMRADVGLRTGNGRVYVNTFNSSLTFTYAPPLNAWTHIAVVADTTGTRLYVNGVLQQTLGVITLGTNSAAPVNIGRTGDNDDPFAGAIDDFRLYKRVLSQTEIQTDMNTAIVP